MSERSRRELGRWLVLRSEEPAGSRFALYQKRSTQLHYSMSSSVAMSALERAQSQRIMITPMSTTTMITKPPTGTERNFNRSFARKGTLIGVNHITWHGVVYWRG